MTVTSDHGAAPTPTPSTAALDQGAAFLSRVREAVAARVVGQDAAIEDALVAFLARGHLLIEGVPGTAKTLLVHARAATDGLLAAAVRARSCPKTGADAGVRQDGAMKRF